MSPQSRVPNPLPAFRSLRSTLWIPALLFTTACASAGPAAQTAPAPTAAASPHAEAIAAGRAAVEAMRGESHTPGVGVAVAVGGEVVWEEGFGYADLELRSPVTPETRFGIGSISKSLTMALVGRLVEEGKVDLDAPLERYLPSFGHPGEGVTVRLVAGHLSGLDDAFNFRHRYTRQHYSNTREALLHIQKERLRHPPGSELFYATGPYTLIAGVVEVSTGMGFLEAMEHYVLDPLGLEDTVPDQRHEIVPHRADFYEQGPDGLPMPARFADPSYKWAGAGYLSTAGDMARFGAALLRPGFLEDETRDELFRSLRTTDGEETGYALGWRVGTGVGKRPIVHQPGGGPGISSWLVLYPEQDVVVAILSNYTPAPVGGPVLTAISEAFLAAAESSPSGS